MEEGILASILKSFPSNYPQKIKIGHINIKSIRYKSDILQADANRGVRYINDFWNQTWWVFSWGTFFRTPFTLDRDKQGGGNTFEITLMLLIHISRDS